MFKHILAGCLTGLIVAMATWSFLPSQQAQSTPEKAKRGLDDKAYLGIVYTQNPDQSLTLTQVYPATPAWDAGLMPGDNIMAVEVLRDGKRAEDFAPATFLLLGLTTAAPGTEFRVKVHRGDKSQAVEKAVLVDFPKQKCEIPAVSAFFEHIQTAMKNWNGREQVWVTIKSCSFKEFSDFHMREQQVELMRTQILELQVRMVKEEAETKEAMQSVQTLIAKQKLAEAQTLLAQIQQAQQGFTLAKLLFGLISGFFAF